MNAVSLQGRGTQSPGCIATTCGAAHSRSVSTALAERGMWVKVAQTYSRRCDVLKGKANSAATSRAVHLSRDGQGHVLLCAHALIQQLARCRAASNPGSCTGLCWAQLSQTRPGRHCVRRSQESDSAAAANQQVPGKELSG